MANITVSVPTSNITVDTTNSIVNVASTSSNVVVGETTFVSNAIIRAALSVTDTGGDGSLAYNDTSGVFTYTGPSAAEVRAHIGNVLPITYDVTTGVIGFDQNLDDLTLKKYQETIVNNGSASGNLNANITNGTVHQFIVNGDITGITLQNISTGGSATLFLTQDGVGGSTIDLLTTPANWTNWKFTNEFTILSSGPSEWSALNVFFDGTDYYATLITEKGSTIGNDDLANSNIIINNATTAVNETLVLGSNTTFSSDATTEGTTNLYFTDPRSRSAISGGTGITYDSATGVITSDNVGDITSVTAGLGLTGGGNGPGAVTLNAGPGDGITVDATSINLASYVAGGGLGYNAGVLDVGAGVGLTQGTNNLNVDLVGLTTDNLTEGTNNLYLTGPNIQDFLNGTGVAPQNYVITVPPTASFNNQGVFIANRILVDGNGVPGAGTLTVGNGSLSVSDNISGGGNLDADSNLTVGSSLLNSHTMQGNTTITGNLTVGGNIDYVQSQDLLVKDQSISLNVGNVVQDGFIIIDRQGTGGGANTDLRWNESLDKWQFTNNGTTYFNMPTTSDDVAQGTQNKYFTTNGAAVNTDSLTEGSSNLYYTQVRVRSDVDGETASPTGTGSLVYDSATGMFTYTPPDISNKIEKTSLSTATASASGGGSLAYNNSTGVFTFAPADTQTDAEVRALLSTTTGTASGGGSLVYDNTSGVFTYAPSIPGIQLSALSTATASASGGGSLAYDNTSGVFTFAPADVHNAYEIVNGTSSVSIPVTSGVINLQVGGNAVANYSTDLSTVSVGSFVVGRSYTIDTPGTTNFTLVGAANSTAGTIFVATGTGVFRAGTFVVGESYTIVDVDTTDFTLIGAASNTVGVVFTATGVGTKGGTATQGTGTVIATYPAEFQVEGDITAVNNIYADVDVIAFANVSASKNVQAVQTASTTVGGVQAINGFSTIGSYNNAIPFVNTETGLIAVQAGDLAANVYSVPRYSSVKMPTIPANVDGGQFTPENIERIGNASSVWDNTASAMPPSSLVAVYDPKIYKRRAFDIPNYNIFYSGEGATTHSTGSILFDTDSGNTKVQSGQSFGNLYGQPAYTNAPVSQGIIKFRTLQPAILGSLPTPYAYTEANDFANSTVAYIDDKLRVGREDNSTSFSFPKTAGAVNQTLVLDGSRDLGFEDKGQTISYTTAEISALASPVTGHVVYNITLAKLCFYNGSSWQQVTSTNM